MFQHPGLHLLQPAIYPVTDLDVSDDAERSDRHDLVTLARFLAGSDTRCSMIEKARFDAHARRTVAAASDKTADPSAARVCPNAM